MPARRALVDLALLQACCRRTPTPRNSTPSPRAATRWQACWWRRRTVSAGLIAPPAPVFNPIYSGSSSNSRAFPCQGYSRVTTLLKRR